MAIALAVAQVVGIVMVELIPFVSLSGIAKAGEVVREIASTGVLSPLDVRFTELPIQITLLRATAVTFVGLGLIIRLLALVKVPALVTTDTEPVVLEVDNVAEIKVAEFTV
ncbi:hypothetical protein WFZ85_00935 [Flavobacterium sp. j3]|uniref:Uncharacterized protein n=1 Tax=Flavobacterium aureirubrum TaxID=3133147 RepID=A0ABU9N0B6_9FLAO